jgi:DNA ligase 1
MKKFASLIEELIKTTKTKEKLSALENYFAIASDKDKIWVIALFTGRRPKRTISSSLLKKWCAEFCNIPLWLLDECYFTVGDLSETIALLINAYYKPAEAPSDNSLYYYAEKFRQLQTASEEEKKQFMLHSWAGLQTTIERFLFNKLLSGSFRIGVSQQLIVQALAKITHKEPSSIAHKITGKWEADSITFNELMSDKNINSDSSKPYPFYLAYPLENALDTLGAIKDWQVEWKWDGIRGQLIKRNNEFFVWSRGEELMTERFPEYKTISNLLPNGTVLDGEIIGARGNQPLPFSVIQTRIGRKNTSKKIMQDSPVSFFAYDILEFNNKDLRIAALDKRRKILEQIVSIVNNDKLQISPKVECSNWEELSILRDQSRYFNAEGFMLKRKDSIYQTGRKRGDWWKWKIDPLTIDAVLVYAQKGSGRRSNLYSDYTFALRDGESLIPFAKAYSGLTDKELAIVDNFVKRNAVEKFGPVRTVKPELVFELAFEGIASSKRHKSGVSVRFPRISKWRHDKKINEINTIDDLKKMLELYKK